jgi:hypothetical protein
MRVFASNYNIFTVNYNIFTVNYNYYLNVILWHTIPIEKYGYLNAKENRSCR